MTGTQKTDRPGWVREIRPETLRVSAEAIARDENESRKNPYTGSSPEMGYNSEGREDTPVELEGRWLMDQGGKMRKGGPIETRKNENEKKNYRAESIPRKRRARRKRLTRN